MVPCPFCCAVNNNVIELAFDQGFAVFCFGCAATGPQMETPEEAETAWVNRDEIDAEEFDNLFN